MNGRPLRVSRVQYNQNRTRYDSRGSYSENYNAPRNNDWYSTYPGRRSNNKFNAGRSISDKLNQQQGFHKNENFSSYAPRSNRENYKKPNSAYVNTPRYNYYVNYFLGNNNHLYIDLFYWFSPFIFSVKISFNCRFD